MPRCAQGGRVKFQINDFLPRRRRVEASGEEPRSSAGEQAENRKLGLGRCSWWRQLGTARYCVLREMLRVTANLFGFLPLCYRCGPQIPIPSLFVRSQDPGARTRGAARKCRGSLQTGSGKRAKGTGFRSGIRIVNYILPQLQYFYNQYIYICNIASSSQIVQAHASARSCSPTSLCPSRDASH